MFQKRKLTGIESHKKDWKDNERGKLPDDLEIQGGTNTPPQAVYTPVDIEDLDYTDDLGFPGEYPYTRGIWPSMFRSRLWTRPLSLLIKNWFDWAMVNNRRLATMHPLENRL